MDSPVIIEFDNDSALVAWNSCKDAVSYELQMCADTDEENWITLSSTIQGLKVRKKNLSSQSFYRFLLMF